MNRVSTYPTRSPRRRERKYRLIFFGTTLALVLLAVGLTQCAVKSRNVSSVPGPLSTLGLEIPGVENPEFLVVCPEGRYTLLYDTLYRQAAWTAHILTRSDVEEHDAQRRNRFVICREVQSRGWPHAKDKDYTRSGYDRGHLVPSADRKSSQQENDATFRLSNIAPQTPRLNRVVWNQLESEVRRLAHRLDTLWIVTGSELKPGLKRIGESGVGVPDYFYKVLLARKAGEFMAIAFIVPNAEEIAGNYWDYAVPVREAERLSGFDFFPGLPQQIQLDIESVCRPEDWRN